MNYGVVRAHLRWVPGVGGLNGRINGSEIRDPDKANGI